MRIYGFYNKKKSILESSELLSKNPCDKSIRNVISTFKILTNLELEDIAQE